MMQKLMVFFTVMILLTGSPAFCEETPVSSLKKVVDAVLVTLNDPVYHDVIKRDRQWENLYALIKSIFDFRTLSMGALGSHWRGFSDQQKDEFTDYFSRLIARTYFDKMEGKTIENVTIAYTRTETIPATKSGTERSDVYTEINQSGTIIPVDYRMLKDSEGKWKVYDVKIEGVSLVANYREQYRQRFSDTPDTLIAELRDKVKK
ncbi:MAG: ABC transporter substrate-binding protein [Pseudomonadota bacterium]